MDYATNFAIVENGIVTNIIWGMIYSVNEFPGAVRIDDRLVQIGDSYQNGIFYHDGEPVRTLYEDVEMMRAEIELLRATGNE